ncbi:MAG: hypothetical protein ALAOOOJD_01991 [bacterium]|nr:hypothetical protein [bacterium]
MFIDEFLSEYDVTEHHHLDFDASAEKVYAAVRELDVNPSKVIRALFALRGLPAFLFSRQQRGHGLGLNLAGLLKSGFIFLAEAPQQELVLGLVGKFWTTSGCIQRLDAAGFQHFAIPGFAKAVWNFSLEARSAGITRLHTETRVLCLDAASRRRFRFYWLFIRSFSGLVRIEILRAIKRSAELV